ncbi:thiopurine S-methyltransferase [Ferrimonas marina]|uniref:Thiopurine S-methyltransferase n=1 Tax=Ferrimonas marina TaxID=299255 RepID=A0A1M5ZL14_9GAMM|nr:thiopurine S-methyltransferase [Ferrimonas marina]SHI24997.1 thiopurine S-methyltransferase [Ferrimonas marina]
MEASFWHAKWEQNQIGFHLDHINPYLQRHWPELGLSGGTVFVPLCGKSLDLTWLARQGFSPVGAELDRRAVEQLFDEQGMVPTITPEPPLHRFAGAGIEVLQGDFFALTPDHLPRCDAFYDRAALIALPEQMRARYVTQLAALVPAGARGLLVTLEYPQAQLAGPPFSVPESEVQALLAPHFELELLSRQDVLADNGRFQAKGVERLEECCYRLVRR